MLEDNLRNKKINYHQIKKIVTHFLIINFFNILKTKLKKR